MSERTGWHRRLRVRADGKGLVGHVGAVPLRRCADRVALSGGLADLYGVVSDYVYVLTISVIHRKLMADAFLAVIVLSESPGPAGEDPAARAARAAWDQVNRLRACLFGFGMLGPFTQITDAGPQDAFWALHADTAEDFRPTIERYRRLLDALADTRGVPDSGPALPLVQLPGGRGRPPGNRTAQRPGPTLDLGQTRPTDPPLTTAPRALEARSSGPQFLLFAEHALHATARCSRPGLLLRLSRRQRRRAGEPSSGRWRGPP